MLNFMEVAFPTGVPVWTTDNEVIYEDHSILLRCFRSSPGEPTLIVPPQAGHSSAIADYDHGQSLVATVLENTEGPVYAIDWKSATLERKDDTINDLVTSVLYSLIYSGPAHLIGLCQGGWLATLVAARYPFASLSLMPIAAPIDFHAGGGHIFETITELGIEPYQAIVEANGGLMTGDMMLFGWKLMNFADRYLGDYMDIWTDVLLGNQKKLKKVKRFRTWYEYTQDLSGAWYLQACEELFLRNLLVSGDFKVHGFNVQLSDIKCPVAMLAGELDDITLEEQLFALGDYVQGRVYEATIPKCGHVGCFMGSKSQEYIAEAVRWIHE